MNPITKTSGPCVVLAGAGTGKTHIIIEKLKYIFENQIYPIDKIVCITFSNEAANNLYSRIKPFVKEKEPLIKTFHSFSADLLREHGEKIGIKTNFSVLTPDDAKILLHKFFRVLPNNCHKYIETIGTAKDLGIKEEEFEKYLFEKVGKQDIEKSIQKMHLELQNLNLELDKEKKKEFSKKMKEFSELKNLKNFIASWKAYEKIKKRHNYLDYSDLNKIALELFGKFPEISESFKYVIVDEFQDTNKIQLDFLFKLAPKGNLMVVGDLNQSIYRFRGAYKENLGLFKDKFGIKEEEIFNLDKSFRSSNKILDVAHELIVNNYLNKEECFKVFNAHGKQGDNVEVYEMKNAKEEARKIVELIKKEVKNGKSYEDICVMFRTHQQGRIIKNYLNYREIPFSSITNESLLKKDKIKMTIDFLKIVYYLKENKNGGEQAWWDLIYQKSFPKNDLIKIGNFIKKNSKKQCLSRIFIEEILKESLSDEGKIIVKSLVNQINSFLEKRNDKVENLIKEIYKNLNVSEEDKSDLMDLSKFYEIAVEHSKRYYEDLANFVNYLEILETLGIHIESSNVENSGVRLMTIHSTKGLEFDTVIITNMSQQRFPIERVRKNSLLPLEIHPELADFKELDSEEKEEKIKDYSYKNQILEERRLGYVSFTRAKNKLILTYAKEYGNKKSYPSQFLNEINYKENPNINFFQDTEEKYKEPEIKIKKMNFGEMIDEKKSIKSLSPSALILFKKCQKEFEYKYIFKMPEPRPVAWEEIRLGSFIHLILEKGVARGLTREEDFIALANKIQLEDEWKTIDIDEAIYLIKVFYQRNKNKFSPRSKTEQLLTSKINGMNFVGFADRIDFSPEGIEIIDYKTGRSKPYALDRNFQLGYYAIAARKFGKVKKITLDLLRQDFPMEFEIDDKGIARFGRTWFSLDEVEEEIIKTTEEIKNALEKGFKVCSQDKNCEFCNEWVYKKD
jgi:DNA helicase II / ATP-dependent DNA helicase PcrA